MSLLLASSTFAVFWPVVGYGFINWDDHEYFVSNPHVQGGLTWRSLVWSFQVGYAANWHPLTWWSLMLDVTLFGKGAFGPHLVNLLSHVANTVLLFALFRKLTGAHWRSALLAGLFALHPLHVESVAWVSERKDVLSTFFGLLCLLAYAAYVSRLGRRVTGEGSRVQSPKSNDSGGGSRVAGRGSREERAPDAAAGSSSPAARHPSLYYVLALLLFACSLMSKPMLVTLPFVMLLLDYWPLRRLRSLSGRAGLRAVLGLVREKAAFLLLSAASCVVTVLAQSQAMQPLASYSAMMRVENALVACASYLGKSSWPVGLVLPYPHPGHWPAAQVALAVLVLGGICVAALWLGRRQPFLVTGVFWFFGMLVPVIGLVQVGEQAMANRYMYLPQTGLWLALLWAGAEAVARWRVPKGVVAVGAGSVLIACAWLTRDQLRYWANSESLFGHTLTVTPVNAAAHYTLALYYEARGQADQAIQHYRQAVQDDPGHASARVNLGAALARRQEFDEANEQFSQALRIAPHSAPLHNNLGVALAGLRQFDRAIDQYQEALRIAPDYAPAQRNLGQVLLDQGRYQEAVQRYLEALRLAPDARACNNLGYALAASGRRPEAIKYYREAIRLDPSLAEAYNNLGNALVHDNRADDALDAYRQALRLNPNDALTLNNLGFALAAKRQYAESAGAFEAALLLTPGFVAARLNLGDALAAQGRLQEAAGQCREVLRLDPSNPKAHFGLGRVLAELGQTNAAVAQLAEALRLKPDYEAANQLLRKLAPNAPR